MSMQLLFILLSPLLVFANINWEDLTEKLYLHPESFDLTPIGNGSTNANYHLTFDECHYFVRIAPEDAELLGASIETEYEVLQAIQNLHIAPEPIHLNLARRILVTEFISGVHEVDLSDPAIRQKVFSLLHEIEASHIGISRVFQPTPKVLHLNELTKTPALTQEILSALTTIDRLLELAGEKILSHFDLHHGNILTDGDRIWFVDWEYAAMGDRFLSLATMASTERWSDHQMNCILQEYLPTPTEEDFQSLFLNRIVMDIHWAAWCRAQKSLSHLEMPYEEWEKEYMTAILSRIRSPQYTTIIRNSK